MALNFQGVGFSFAAKDTGLVPLQQRIAAGFFDMSASLTTLHKKSKPAFADLGVSLGKVEMSLGRQETRVREWSEGVVASIDKIGEKASALTSPFKKTFEAIGSGARVVANTWENTFGKSFETLGHQIDGIGNRFRGIIDATKPIQDKFSSMWKRATEAMSPFTGAFMRAKDKIHEFLAKSKETDEESDKSAEKYEKRAKIITAATKTIVVGFDGIKGVMHKLNQVLRVNKLRGFMEAISIGMLSKVAGGIERLGSAGMNLTTSLEGEFVRLNKDAKTTAVNLGLTGKELQAVQGRAAGMAHSLNIGAGESTKALVGFKDAASEMNAIGIDSAATLAKLGDVAGVDATQFSFMLKHMRKLRMGDEEIKGIVSSFTAMGQETRDVSGALGSIAEIMETVEKKAALMGGELEPKQLAAMAKQTAAYAAGLGKMGHKADKARSLALGMAETLVENQKQFQNLFVGTADDIGELPKELGAITGDLQSAFKLMGRGPEGFVMGLQSMVESADKAGVDTGKVMEFMRGRLEKAGIQGVEPLVNFLRDADANVIRTMASVNTATKDLGKLAKSGFSTGRTLQEAFDIAKESAIAHFRASGKASGTFLKDFSASAKKFNQILDDTSKKGGPLGNFVDKLRDVHRIGAAGLLPREMQGAGILLAEIGQQLGPLLGVLGGAVLFFPGLTAVLGPVVTILGLFAINLFKAKLAGESWADALGTAFDATLKIIEGWVGYIEKALPKIIDGIMKVLPGVIDAVGKMAPKLFAAWQKIQTTIVEAIIKYAPVIVDAFVSVVGKVIENFGKLAPKLIDAFVGIFGALVKALPVIVPKLVEVFGTVLDAVIKGLTTLIPVLVDTVIQLIPELVKGLTDAATKIVDAIAKLAPVLIDGFVALLGALAKELPQLLGKIIPAVIKGLEVLIGAILRVAPEIVDALLGALIGFVDKLPEMVPQLIKAFMGLLPKLVDAVSKVLVALANAIPKILPPLLDAIVKGLLAIVDALPALLPALVKGLIAVISAIVDALPKILPAIMMALRALVDGFVKALPVLLPLIVESLVKLFIAVIPMLIEVMPILAKQIFSALFGEGNIFGMIWDLLVALVKGIWKALSGLVTTYILEPLGDIWTLLEIPSLSDMFDGLKDAASSVWDYVTGLFDAMMKPFAELWDTIKPYLKGLLKGILKVFLTPFLVAWLVLQKVFEKPFKFLAKIAKKVVDGVKKGFDKFFRFVKRKWKEFTTQFTKAIDSLRDAWENVKTKITGVFDDILSAAKKLWDDIVNAAGKVWDRIKESWGDVKKFFGDLFDGILEVIKPPWEGVKAFITGIWTNENKTGIKDIWNKATEFFRGLWGDIARIMKEIWGEISKKVKEALGPLMELFEMLDGWIDKLFEHSIDTDVNEAMGAAAGFMKTHTQAMMTMAEKWGTKTEKIFKDTFADVLRALKDFANKAEGRFEKLTKRMVTDFADAFDTIADLAGIVDLVMSNMTLQVVNAMNHLQKLTGKVRVILEELEDARKEAEDAIKKGKAAKRGRGTVQLVKFEGELAKSMTDAINKPDWYWKHARKQFAQMIATQEMANKSIVAALATMSAQGTGAGKGKAEIAKIVGEYKARVAKRAAPPVEVGAD